MPAPVILGVNCIVVLPTKFLVGVDVVQVANPAAPPHRRYTILCVVWFVGDALPRPLISIRAWTVPELNHTAQTIANISRRAAGRRAAVRVKQDLISCLTRRSERKRRTTASLAVQDTTDQPQLITTRNIGSQPPHHPVPKRFLCLEIHVLRTRKRKLKIPFRLYSQILHKYFMSPPLRYFGTI